MQVFGRLARTGPATSAFKAAVPLDWYVERHPRTLPELMQDLGNAPAHISARQKQFSAMGQRRDLVVRCMYSWLDLTKFQTRGCEDQKSSSNATAPGTKRLDLLHISHQSSVISSCATLTVR
jgi:hypothetical protein